jgi:ketosteroid isomerase-like protein
MSQENVEVVRRFFDALNARDEAAWLDLVHPDAEFTSLIQEVEGTFRGREGAREYFRGLQTTFSDFRGDVERICEGPSGVAAEIRTRGTGHSGGTAVDLTDWLAMTQRDGKAIWWAFFRTEAEALQAVGLEA